MRLGRYAEASTANRAAIRVDKEYLRRADPSGMYAMMYVGHNYRFLWASASLEGRSAEAIKAARDLRDALPIERIRSLREQSPAVDYDRLPGAVRPAGGCDPVKRW
jgi:hypothetical protein